VSKVVVPVFWVLILHFQHAFAATQIVAHRAALTPEYAKTSSHETSGSVSIESINLAAASILESGTGFGVDSSGVMLCSC
jgi:hypothetical protein